ncbi:MAG TPA: hypothetical protein VLA72_04510, partial [Anaerolineales bacterium]|nr:hypothetical protein [Anaerolineales bacterium]
MNDEKVTKTNKYPLSNLQWDDVLRILGSIAGFIGVAGALLWLFGRYFYSGAFSAFGFPSLAIALAPEDYLERGAGRFVFFLIDLLGSILLYYFAYIIKIFYYENISRRIENRLLNLTAILVVFFICVATGIYLLLNNNSTEAISFFLEDLSNLASVLLLFLGFEIAFLVMSPSERDNYNLQSQNQLIVSTQTPIAIARILMVVVMLASFVFIQAWSSFASGQRAGCITILRKSSAITIFSTENILAEGQTNLGDLYRYEGYFLLFIDK